MFNINWAPEDFENNFEIWPHRVEEPHAMQYL